MHEILLIDYLEVDQTIRSDPYVAQLINQSEEVVEYQRSYSQRQYINLEVILENKVLNIVVNYLN